MIVRGTALLAMSFVFLAETAKADFVLIDDFDSYIQGTAIDGQGAWQAEAGNNPVAARVSVDPLAASNRALTIGDGGFVGGRLGHRETINTDARLRIPDGNQATLFFRIAWSSGEDIDLSAGMSDVANPITETLFNSFTQFESQAAFPFAAGFDNVGVRDADGLKSLSDNVGPLTWYSMWLAIDNAADTTQLFIQGGDFTNQTQLGTGGQSVFPFRNGIDNNDLITFFIATGRNTTAAPPSPTENIGPVYLDDIYIDTSGQNLVNPVPEPSTLLLGIVGLAAFAIIAARRRRS